MRLEEEIKQKKFPDEYEKLLVNILYTSSWLTNRQAKHFKKYDITGPQYNILRILRGQYPKPATVSLLIDRMIDKMSNASRIVDRLEKKGLVTRTICPDDRRAVDVKVTDKGLDLLSEMDAVSKKWAKELTNLDKKEVKELNDLLDKLRG